VGIFHSPYDSDTRRGRVEEIRFEDIRLMAGVLPRIFVEGCDPKHSVRNVRFDNFRMGGALYRSVLNRNFGLPPSLPAWPERTLDQALGEVLTAAHASDLLINGRPV